MALPSHLTHTESKEGGIEIFEYSGPLCDVVSTDPHEAIMAAMGLLRPKPNTLPADDQNELLKSLTPHIEKHIKASTPFFAVLDYTPFPTIAVKLHTDPPDDKPKDKFGEDVIVAWDSMKQWSKDKDDASDLNGIYLIEVNTNVHTCHLRLVLSM